METLELGLAYLSLLLGHGLDGDRGRLCSCSEGWNGAARALVAAVVLVGAPGAGRLQLRVKLAVRRGGRRGQHQSLQRRHFSLKDIDLGVTGEDERT